MCYFYECNADSSDETADTSTREMLMLLVPAPCWTGYLLDEKLLRPKRLREWLAVFISVSWALLVVSRRYGHCSRPASFVSYSGRCVYPCTFCFRFEFSLFHVFHISFPILFLNFSSLFLVRSSTFWWGRYTYPLPTFLSNDSFLHFPSNPLYRSTTSDTLPPPHTLLSSCITKLGSLHMRTLPQTDAYECGQEIMRRFPELKS